MSVYEAATRIVQRVPDIFERRGALVLASAGAIGGAPTHPRGSRAARFIMHAGAATVRPMSRSTLAELAATVPVGERLESLAAAESLLARIDPHWAWELIQNLVGRDEAIKSSTLGLDIASHLDAASADRLFGEKCRLNSLFAEQFGAEGAARARVMPRIDPRNVKPFASGAYLAAAALTGTHEGLVAAQELLQWLSPHILQEGLCLVAEASVRHGSAEKITQLALQESDVTVQSTWTEAAARSKAMDPASIRAHVRRLSSRVTDELDPGRQLLAALPLLLALAAAGSWQDLATLAVEWRVAPPLVADQLFYSGIGASQSVFEVLMHVPEDEWDDLYDYDFSWWRAAGPEREARVEACDDVVAVGANPPWNPLPGSLKDLVGWP